MTFTSVSLSVSWGVVSCAYVVCAFALFASFQALHHRTGAYGLRNWLVMAASALLYTIALFTSTVLTLLAVSFSSLASPSSPLTLTVDPVLTSVAFVLPLIFILFGLFLCGHPDHHRYLRLPLGALIVAAGTTASQFLLLLAVHLQATYVLASSYVIGVVVMGMVAVPSVLYLHLHQQAKAKATPLTRALFALLLSVCIEAMHLLALRSMTWTYSSDVGVDAPLSPLLIPFGLLLALPLLSLLTSLLLTRAARSADRHSASQCFSLSAYIMDADARVLVTTSGALPSVRIEHVYVGQGAFDAYNRDFVRMLSTSLHWADAFTTLHTLTTAADVTPSSALVYSQFLHAACQLAHNLQVGLTTLGFLYKAPIDDRLVLVSTAAHAGRMTESGVYRWAPKEVVDDFLKAEHGPLVMVESREKMVQVLGEEWAEAEEGGGVGVAAGAGGGLGWVREIERYYQAYHLTIDQRRPSPRASIDIRIAMPPLPGKGGEGGDKEGPDAASSPRSRGVSGSLRRQSGAVSPALPAAAGDEPLTTTSLSVVRGGEDGVGDRVTFELDRWPGNTVKSSTSPRSPSSPASADGCRLYVGMFLAKVTGTQLSILLSRYGASHCIPSVRLRLPSPLSRAAVMTEEERGWLAQQMQSLTTASLPIASNLPSFPLTPSSPPTPFNPTLTRFQQAFFTAVTELSALLGGGKHLSFGKLLSVHPVALSGGVQMLVFCESVMTPHFPLGYDRRGLTFLPCKVFEALHAAKWPAVAPKDWIGQALQSTTKSADRSRAWTQSREEWLASEPPRAHHSHLQQQQQVQHSEVTPTPAVTTKTATSATPQRTATPVTEARLMESGTRASEFSPNNGGSRAGDSAISDGRVGTPHSDRTVSRAVSKPTSGGRAGNRPGSRPGSRPVSATGSQAGSASHSRRGSYEVKERTMVMDGKLVVVVRVRDAEEEREKEERRRRRRERREREELEMRELPAAAV